MSPSFNRLYYWTYYRIIKTHLEYDVIKTQLLSLHHYLDVFIY